MSILLEQHYEGKDFDDDNLKRDKEKREKKAKLKKEKKFKETRKRSRDTSS